MVLNGHRDPSVGRAAELVAKAGWQLQLVPSGDDPVRRRAFLLTAAGAGAGLAFDPPKTANPYSDPGYVDGLTARLVYNEDQMGGTPLAREAAGHAARVVSAARGAGRALQSAASRLCRQAALILHDARSMDRAEETAATALAFGRSAGDWTAQARACDTLSLIAAYLPGGRAVEYARRGLALPDVSASDQAVLAARLGRAAALGGEQYEARGSLEHALELAAQTGPSAEISGNIGIGFTDLRMPGRAGQYLAKAVSLSASSPFLRSLYLSRLTKAAMRGQQPDLAAQEMTELASVVPLVQSPRLVYHVRHIIDGTDKWASIPGIRDAREALKEVTA